MSEQAPRWNYGNQHEITADEFKAAYGAAPACHHPSPKVEVQPADELLDEIEEKSVAYERARNQLKNIALIETMKNFDGAALDNLS